MYTEIAIDHITPFKIGHAQNAEAATGCTVILSEKGAVTGVDVRGGSPGTRETDLLKSENLVDQVHATFLSGGSAYGLDVGTGVMNYLEEHNIGFDVQVARVPIVPGAILFDLAIGDPSIRPNARMGYQACLNTTNAVKQQGNIGAGYGATVGKCLGSPNSMKAGLGTYAIEIGKLQIGAIIAVNSFGDIIDPTTNQVIAGVRDHEAGTFLYTEKQLLQQLDMSTNRFSGNTTIGTIITNAKATKANMNKIASIAHDGIARTMRPSHTLVDGDTLFAMTSNEVEVDINIVGMLAATVTEKAIINAIKHANSLFGIPSYQELYKK
ncbi:peptidase [Paraliobacillus quinghaiensis]|uniref:Peptidase n=1 Tax=Paraliobacillus quinghaiensis TaxID=470815 RepID=A0A917TIB6_9BACI|nr:P1 family peptidase [Paraliobacillus quinghaiensis]GGM23398.1 peptidase [Paraliobacillus quinghaiensis]